MPPLRQPKVNVMSQDPTQPPAAVDITQTPEFSLAVSAAVGKAMAPIMESLAKLNAPAPAAPGQPADLESFFRQMALSIAEISDQGTSRKRVAPEILAQRAKSHDLMIEAILDADREHKENGAERPYYRAIGKMYLNERFIEPFVVDPGTKKPVAVEFYWSGVPNEVMRPLNAAAEKIFEHFRDSIGSFDKVAETKALWITAGGLVIKGEGPERRAVGSVDAAGRPVETPFKDDLVIMDGGLLDPNASRVAVLGTVAAPARQNIAERRV